MMDVQWNSEESFADDSQPSKGRQRIVIWLLVGFGGCAAIPCTGLLAWILYIGTYGPDTAVYTGNQVPQHFKQVMKQVDALDDDERILFFYSDALDDIREGFYFVSDMKVVIYSETFGDAPLSKIAFDEIALVDLVRDESWLSDSEILLELKDGMTYSFPVLSELDKDQLFYEAIRSRVAESEEAD
jgi:hypothetical protein